MIRRPPRSTQSRSSAASDVYKRQLLSTFTRRCFIEFDVRVARDTGNRHCRYQLCMETLCPESNRRRNALIINDHRVDDTCHYCQLLASEIGDNRDPSSHEQFVGSATNTDDIYSLGSCGNCIVFKLICSVANNFAKNGIMSMYTDVDMVLLQRAEICLGHYHLRYAEQDVRKVRADVLSSHITERAFDAPKNQWHGICITAHMGPVHDFGNSPVNVCRNDVISLKQFEPLCRKHNFEPVSYTHLTLPTIYSV